MYAEMGKTYRELPLGWFKSHLGTSFKAASWIAELTPDWLPNIPNERSKSST